MGQGKRQVTQPLMSVCVWACMQVIVVPEIAEYLTGTLKVCVVVGGGRGQCVRACCHSTFTMQRGWVVSFKAC